MSRLLTAAVLAATVGVVSAQPLSSRLDVGNGEIAYDVSGTGPAVVLLHGGFMDRRAWDAQMPALTSRFRVVRYDIRPFGESTRPDKPYRMTDDLRLLLDHLKIARAHLIGHSLGGQLAIDFALSDPNRVASLVLAGAAPAGMVPAADEAKAIAPIFAAAKRGEEAILQAWLDHPMWSVSRKRPEVIDAIAASTRRSLAAFTMAAPPFLPMEPPAIKRLRDVRAPTLIVVGDRDMPSLRNIANVMANEIPRATLKVIEGADHGLPIGWAGEFNAAVVEFLTRQSQRR